MKNKLNISAVIFTKNESRNIEDCINSLLDFSEVLVVDSMSTDDTSFKSKALGATVINFSWNYKYPKKRQWSLEEISYKNPWILFVDADERVPKELVDELRYFQEYIDGSYVAGSIPIDYYFAGKRLRYGQRPRKVALIKIGRVNYPEIDDLSAKGMGELEGHYQPIVDGSTRKFKNRISHNDNDPISTWMTRHINYAKWESHLLINREVKKSVDVSKGGAVTFFHKLPMRPLAFFVYSYVIRLGFLDGKPGFDYAFAKSWYYWLSGVIAREEGLEVKNQTPR
jgi:glycosyltransferase involved in cell wall biosynthesis